MTSRRRISLLLLLFSLSNLYLTVYLRAVPIRHILFVVITALYACFTNSVIVRTVMPRQPSSLPSLTPMKNAARLLFPFTVIFSLFVPAIVLYVAGTSVVDGSPAKLTHIIAPSLFLVLSQISLEAVGFLFSAVFTIYVRLGVTIAFVVYRIPVMFTWYHEARDWAKSDEATLVAPSAVALAQAGAVINIVFWTFALLCFLLLYCLPAMVCDPSVTIDQEVEKRRKAA